MYIEIFSYYTFVFIFINKRNTIFQFEKALKHIFKKNINSKNPGQLIVVSYYLMYK